MSVECFLDTNVLLYAATASADERLKQDAAYRIIAETTFGISTQVMQEFYVNATTRAKVRMKPDVAIAWLEEIEDRPCVVIDADLVKYAIEISLRHKINYWDAAIVAAAEALGAATLYTEDLNDGQVYGSVRAVDPFSAI